MKEKITGMKNNKPLKQKAYGSIPHLSNSKIDQQADKKISIGQEEILTKKVRDWKDLIIVQEKVDGSCVCIAKIKNKIYALTKAGYEAKTSPFEFLHKFGEWVDKNINVFDDMLENNERLCGEWMLKVHSLKYNLPHDYFVAFDIIRDKKRILYLDFIKRISKYGICSTYLIHIGQPITVKNAMEKMGPGGHGCLEIPEGLVYRAEREGNVDFLAKYVRFGKVDGKYLDENIENLIMGQ